MLQRQHKLWWPQRRVTRLRWPPASYRGCLQRWWLPILHRGLEGLVSIRAKGTEREQDLPLRTTASQTGLAHANASGVKPSQSISGSSSSTRSPARRGGERMGDELSPATLLLTLPASSFLRRRVRASLILEANNSASPSSRKGKSRQEGRDFQLFPPILCMFSRRTTPAAGTLSRN